MTQRLKVHPTHPQARLLRVAATLLQRGGVIAYPTDSSYALGCRIGDAQAARRIRQLRGVDSHHHLTLVCRDLAQVGRFARMDNWQFRIVRQGTPGSFTFLLRATDEVPRRVQHPKRSTIGVRVPDHATAQALLTEIGEPILSSTLILPGEASPLVQPDDIEARLGNRLDAVVDAGACAALPTTVVDLAVSPPLIVRMGGGDPARLGLVSHHAAGLGVN